MVSVTTSSILQTNRLTSRYYRPLTARPLQRGAHLRLDIPVALEIPLDVIDDLAGRRRGRRAAVALLQPVDPTQSLHHAYGEPLRPCDPGVTMARTAVVTTLRPKRSFFESVVFGLGLNLKYISIR